MDKNQQQPSKVVHSAFLEVHSIFHTIQGEGPFSGTPAIFIRLAGCNLQCPQCDTDYTSTRKSYAVSTLVQECQSIAKGCLVVITGGEPFRQDLSALFLALHEVGYFVQVETNGTLPAPISLLYNKNILERKGVYIICSPKTGTINPTILDNACALKYVANADDIGLDGLPVRALNHKCHPYLARPPKEWSLPIYLQPADVQDEEENFKNLHGCIQACLKHGYTLQLQLHKIIGLA